MHLNASNVTQVVGSSDEIFVLGSNNFPLLYNNISTALPPAMDNISDEALYMYCGEGLLHFRQTYNKMHGYVSLIVCLFGMLANGLNVIVLTRRDMISPTNAILTGLAFADILVMTEYIPYTVHMYILRDRPIQERFAYGWTVFVLFHAHVTQVFHTISIWLTVTLAVWRYLAVAHPLRNRDWCSLDRALLAIVSGYVGSPFLCIPAYLTYSIQEKKYWLSPTNSVDVYVLGTSELARAHDGLLQKVNFWVYSVVIKIIPCIALTVLSFQLIRALMEAKKRKQNLKMKNRIGGAAAASDKSVPGKEVKSQTSKSDSGDRQHTDRTTRMLLAVLFLFLITEFPQGILGLLSGILGEAFFSECYNHLGEIMDILALFNSAVNFILYCVMSRQFRQTFSRTFKPHMFTKWILIPSKEPQAERNRLNPTSPVPASAQKSDPSANRQETMLSIETTPLQPKTPSTNSSNSNTMATCTTIIEDVTDVKV